MFTKEQWYRLCRLAQLGSSESLLRATCNSNDIKQEQTIMCASSQVQIAVREGQVIVPRLDVDCDVENGRSSHADHLERNTVMDDSIGCSQDVTNLRVQRAPPPYDTQLLDICPTQATSFT